MSIQNGKKPLSARPAQASIAVDDIFGNPLTVPADVRAACEQKKLAYRFISYSKLSEMGGYHERGWRPVTRKELECDKLDSNSFQFGNTPDGLIRRGTLVLAVRPKEINDKHVAYLRQEALRSSNLNSRQAEEIRKVAGAGIGISDGYDDENK